MEDKEKDFTTATDFKKINTPSPSILKHYEKLYDRNQNKFIRRSKLESSHRGSEFEYLGRQMKIVGSIDERQLLVLDMEEDLYYMIHIDIPTEKILNP
jgi:hypothetical protein